MDFGTVVGIPSMGGLVRIALNNGVGSATGRGRQNLQIAQHGPTGLIASRKVLQRLTARHYEIDLKVNPGWRIGQIIPFVVAGKKKQGFPIQLLPEHSRVDIPVLQARNRSRLLTHYSSNNARLLLILNTGEIRIYELSLVTQDEGETFFLSVQSTWRTYAYRDSEGVIRYGEQRLRQWDSLMAILSERLPKSVTKPAELLRWYEPIVPRDEIPPRCGQFLWFNVARGSGHAQIHDEDEPVFVHHSQLACRKRRSQGLMVAKPHQRFRFRGIEEANGKALKSLTGVSLL